MLFKLQNVNTIKKIDLGIFNPIHFLIISILLSVPVIIFDTQVIYLLPIATVLLFSVLFGERFIIAITLITLFTLISEINESLRFIVQISSFVVIMILFLKKYGLNFDKFPRVPKSIQIFFYLYFISIVISAVMSKHPYECLDVIFRQSTFFIIVYLFYSLITEKKDINNYFNSILIVSCITVSLLLLSFIESGFNLLTLISKNRIRLTAISSNAEALTNVIVISVPIIISFLLATKNSLKKLNYWLLLIFFLMGLIFAMSRSAILGIISSTAIIYFILFKKYFYKFLTFLIVTMILFILIDPLSELATFLFRVNEGASTRDYIWSMSLDMIKDYPLFGLGPGVYKYEMFNYLPFMLDNFYGRLYIYYYEVTGGANLSHNIFLVFFTEMGILGLLTILLLPIVYIRIGIKTIIKFRNNDQITYYFIVGLFAAGCSVIVRNLFNSIGLLYVGGIYTDLPFWLIFASLVYFYKKPININTPAHEIMAFTNSD
jgi:O-antigen ligase